MVYDGKVLTVISRRDILLASLVGVGLSPLVGTLLPKSAVAASDEVLDDLAAPTPEEIEQVSAHLFSPCKLLSDWNEWKLPLTHSLNRRESVLSLSVKVKPLANKR